MKPASITLDHVAFGTGDPKTAAGQALRLGFSSTSVSRCSWELAGSHYAADAISIVFPRQYLDFIHVTSPEWMRHLASSSMYRGGSASTGIVLSGVPVAQAYASLATEDGSHPRPYPIRRRIDDTEPPVEVDYEFLSLPGTGLPLALISDSSPEALRREAWLVHSNTAVGLRAVHLRVPSRSESLSAIRDSPLSARPSPGSSDVALGSTRLVLHERPSESYLHEISALLHRAERPALLALEFQVASLDAAADVLRTQQVGFTRELTRIEVKCDEGFGCGIVFTDELRNL